MPSDDLLTLSNKKLFELTLCRAKDCISTELDGETVILDVATGIYSGLDPVGTFIWDQLEQPVTIAILREKMLERYEVSEDQCITDLLFFLKDLAENGLITIRNE